MIMVHLRRYVIGISLSLAFSGTLLAPSPTARAAETARVAVGRWEVIDGKEHVLIPVGEFLSAKQRNVIDSGFTTLTQLSLLAATSKDDRTLVEFKKHGCSLKFDTWEERYDVTIVATKPRPLQQVKTFAELSDHCLTGDISDPTDIASLRTKGGTLLLEFRVQQISQDQADSIKKYLISQQSSLMQGLFAHMIGELSLNDQFRVQVRVPVKPAIIDVKPAQVPSPSTNATKKGG